jgi:pimeloyl-ACP methyl ester carboxylesterase
MLVRSWRDAAAVTIVATLAAAGCASTGDGGAQRRSDVSAMRVAAARVPVLDRALEERILAIDPGHVTEHDVRATLAFGPTPRIILLHGSMFPASAVMSSFAEFLKGMGYPDGKLRDPADGAYSRSPYDSSERLAGAVAWYYEHDGVRPMLVGHSLGGMQAIKVLHELAGDFDASIPVWNPVSDRAEARTTIVDPISGAQRPVVGVSVSYAAAVAAGGAALMMPSQWNMMFRLRRIPRSVEEFTGYSIQGDMIAWTNSATSGVTDFRRDGAQSVRNVMLPVTYNHLMVPVTHALATDARTRAWINAYVPRDGERPDVPDDVIGHNVLWAADVWYGIKKHWALEAQRLVRAHRAASETTAASGAAPERAEVSAAPAHPL